SAAIIHANRPIERVFGFDASCLNISSLRQARDTDAIFHRADIRQHEGAVFRNGRARRSNESAESATAPAISATSSSPACESNESCDIAKRRIFADKIHANIGHLE